MNGFKTLGCTLAVAALMAGCASDVKLDDAPPVESRTPTAVGTLPGGANAGSTGSSGVSTVDLNARNATPSAAERTVYFEFDSYVVRDQYLPIIETNGKVLASDRTKRMTIEGHTDSRGGREYNLALGQRRAEAVLRQLTLIGATRNQLEAVSYGQERPAVPGTDEESAAKNRRAEMNYR